MLIQRRELLVVDRQYIVRPWTGRAEIHLVSKSAVSTVMSTAYISLLMGNLLATNLWRLVSRQQQRAIATYPVISQPAVRTIPSTKTLCKYPATLLQGPSVETGTVSTQSANHSAQGTKGEKASSSSQKRKKKPENFRTYPAQTKLANHPTSTASSRTTILDRRRPGVAAKGVQLELRLVAHLGGETLVACDVEVCAARDLVVGDALARFDVAQDAYVRPGRHSGVTTVGDFAVLTDDFGEWQNKQATITDVPTHTIRCA